MRSDITATLLKIQGFWNKMLSGQVISASKALGFFEIVRLIAQLMTTTYSGENKTSSSFPSENENTTQD